MSGYDIPNKLYHGLTIDQFLEHWQAGAIRGLSRHHLNTGGGKNGTWLSDDFEYILKHKHGEEVIGESEVLADWSDILKKLGLPGDGKIRQQFYNTKVIAELSGVPDSKELVPYVLPHQLFYFGDIPKMHISAIYLDQIDHTRREEDIRRLIIASVPREIIKIDDRFKAHKY